MLTLVMAQSVAEGIREVTGMETGIKWPNDIFWKDKKICGTLIETDLTGIHISRSISGSGVNLNQERFLSDAPNPVSLCQITGNQDNPREILEQIIEKVTEYYQLLKENRTEVLETRYKEALYRKEGLHLFRDKDGDFRARIADIEPNGRLILEDEDGQTRGYLFKEVEYIL